VIQEILPPHNPTQYNFLERVAGCLLSSIDVTGEVALAMQDDTFLNQIPARFRGNFFSTLPRLIQAKIPFDLPSLVLVCILVFDYQKGIAYLSRKFLAEEVFATILRYAEVDDVNFCVDLFYHLPIDDLGAKHLPVDALFWALGRHRISAKMFGDLARKLLEYDLTYIYQISKLTKQVAMRSRYSEYLFEFISVICSINRWYILPQTAGEQSPTCAVVNAAVELTTAIETHDSLSKVQRIELLVMVKQFLLVNSKLLAKTTEGVEASKQLEALERAMERDEYVDES
jgi:hypothetical protein